MTKNMKKVLCLFLSVAMVVTLFTACGGKNGDDAGSNPNLPDDSETTTKELAPLNETDEITITYLTWENSYLQDYLAERFNAAHPNLHIEHTFVAYDKLGAELQARKSSGTLPDIFWYPGEVDTPIDNLLWSPMDEYFYSDPENANILKGIVAYKYGNFMTSMKWATPAKVFPSLAWVNQQLFQDNNIAMPSPDWTWEEFETVLEATTIKKAKGQLPGDHPSIGMTCAVYPVTWYCFAADDNCIGEFGWDGTKFNMDKWAEGLDKEAMYYQRGWLFPGDDQYGVLNKELMMEMYGTDKQAQDTGYVAIRPDFWSCWNNYWVKSDFVNNKVLWVPYIMPNAEGCEAKTMFANIDMCGIGASSAHKREAYEALKYMQWSADGWKEKIDIYEHKTNPDTGDSLISACLDVPITLDEDVWKAFRALSCFPQDDDQYARGEYFDIFLNKVREHYWVGYGATQIPGFSTWINNAYHGNIKIETKVLGETYDGNGQKASELQAQLEKQGLQYYNKRIQKLNATVEAYKLQRESGN